MYKIIGGDQKEYGPVSGEEIRQWVAEGRANGQTLVQLEGTREWKPLGSFSELASPGFPSGAPPVPLALGPFTVHNYAASVLSAERQLSVGECMNRGWHLLTANFPLLFFSTILVCGLRTFLSLIPVAGIFALLLTGVFYGGLYVVFLKRLRGQPTSIAEAFSGFGNNFTQLLLVGFISLLLTIFGLCACLLPGIYLFVAWSFAIPLVADKRLGFWDAMELSRKVVTRHWLQIAALLVLCFLPVIVFAIYSNVVASEYMSSLISSGQLDTSLFWSNPTQFLAQVDKASRAIAEKFGHLILFQMLLQLLVQPFAKAVFAHAYEVLFNPGPTPPA